MNTDKTNHASRTPTYSCSRMMWKRTTIRKRQMTRFGMTCKGTIVAHVVASDVAHVWHYWKKSCAGKWSNLITHFQCHMALSLGRFHRKFPTGCFRQLWRKQCRKWGRLQVFTAGTKQIWWCWNQQIHCHRSVGNFPRNVKQVKQNLEDSWTQFLQIYNVCSAMSVYGKQPMDTLLPTWVNV